MATFLGPTLMTSLQFVTSIKALVLNVVTVKVNISNRNVKNIINLQSRVLMKAYIKDQAKE